ncbi:hypothetical protein, partial [Alcanivorax jadensis]|uniref:hypothetical protein n=1 Tax=Alcanivorax jadensis TaxID=64988 RepID=UPI0023567923
ALEPRTAPKRGIVQRGQVSYCNRLSFCVLVKADTLFPRQGSDSRLKRRSYNGFVDGEGGFLRYGERLTARPAALA